MAQAAPAYRYDAYSTAARERYRVPEVRARRTGGTESQATQVSTLVLAAKLAAVVLVVVAALCFARIALTNAAVTTMIESDALSAQIDEARSSGVGLEMEQSALTSTSAINSAVKRLHMAAPLYVGDIALDEDVVAVGADGELSFSGTVKNVAGIQV